LQRAKVAVGIQYAWWLEFGRNDWLEGAISDMLAGFSQISGVPGLGCFENLFLFLVE
jgi:hypothetical protein